MIHTNCGAPKAYSPRREVRRLHNVMCIEIVDGALVNSCDLGNSELKLGDCLQKL